MPGLVPGIHDFLAEPSQSKTWMAGQQSVYDRLRRAMSGHDEARVLMTTMYALKRKWMKDPNFRREYDALEEEFALILEVAKARRRARLSWHEARDA